MHREKTCYCIASAPQKVNTITSRKLENSSSSKIELHEPIEASQWQLDPVFAPTE